VCRHEECEADDSDCLLDPQLADRSAGVTPADSAAYNRTRHTPCRFWHTP